MDVLVTLDVVEGQAHLKTPAETDAGLIDSLVSRWLDGCFGGVSAFKTDAGPIGSYDLMA